jgi:hypothetical protein
MDKLKPVSPTPNLNALNASNRTKKQTTQNMSHTQQNFSK